MTAYFDSSVFLAVLNGESTAQVIRDLLADFQRDHVRVYTSIVTVQEVSVGCYRDGTIATDSHGQVKKIARIEGITRDVALTAAKIEAQILDSYASEEDKSKDNKRRKWDCFHIATAQCLKCSHLYSLDGGMLKRKGQLKIRDIEFSEPKPAMPPLFSQTEFETEQVGVVDENGEARGAALSAPPAVQGCTIEPSEGQVGAEDAAKA